jgi:CRP/FNR family transcriptional regulator
MADKLGNNIFNFFSKYPVWKYPKGQILLHKGESLQDIFYLESGRVRQHITSDNGNEIVLNIFRKNMYFPVHLALTKKLSEHVYSSMNSIEVRKIPVKEFNDFFINSPEVILEHLKESYIRSNKALKRMTYALGSSAYYRLLYELLNECSYVKPHKDGNYHLNIHGYEIAECAGLSRESASRQFHKLKDLNLVKITRKDIIVKDLNKLKKQLSDHI